MSKQKICKLIFTTTIALVLPMFSEAGPCIEATDCFCNLKPGECEVLVTAEVVEAEVVDVPDSNRVRMFASIRVQGQPHYDTRGLVQDGQLIEDLESCYYPHRGDLGLFRVHPSSPCDPDKHIIAGAALISDEKVLCGLDYDFPGATVEDVVAAVFSDDCRAAVLELGVENHCGPGGGACGCPF